MQVYLLVYMYKYQISIVGECTLPMFSTYVHEDVPLWTIRNCGVASKSFYWRMTCPTQCLPLQRPIIIPSLVCCLNRAFFFSCFFSCNRKLGFGWLRLRNTNVFEPMVVGQGNNKFKSINQSLQCTCKYLYVSI